MMVHKAKVPSHIAIIMDGNGRWAENQNQPRLYGHSKGAKTLKDVVAGAAEIEKLRHLTVFAFATSNQTRSQEETAGLQILFVEQANAMLPFLIDNNIRTKVVGDRTDDFIRPEVLRAINVLEKGTSSSTGLQLNLAWNYSGKNEILRAEQAGWSVSRLYDCMFDAPEVGSMDIVIRTGVDNNVGVVVRDSDFFPLLSAGAVKVPMEVLWPDFKTAMHLQYAINCWAVEAHLNGGQRPESDQRSHATQ